MKKPSVELVYELAQASRSEVSREEFTHLFNRAVTALHLKTDDIASLCKTSRLTIERWRAGTSTPHRVGRSSVFSILHKLAVEQRLKNSINDAERGNLSPRPDSSR